MGLDHVAAIEIDYTQVIIWYKQQISYLWKQGPSLSERITTKYSHVICYSNTLKNLNFKILLGTADLSLATDMSFVSLWKTCKHTLSNKY